MKCFRIHLWREWREHQRALGWLAGCIVLANALVHGALPKFVLPLAESMAWSALLGALVVGLSVGADLFASESARGTDAFLRRTPGGLTGAFAAKLSMFGLMITGAALWGACVGFVANELHDGDSIVGEWSIAWSAEEWLRVGAYCLALLLWCFAVSSWVKSGALTLPATLLFLAAMLWPAGAMLERMEWSTSDSELILLTLGLMIIGPAVCAFVAFVIGARHGRRRSRATFASVLLACLVFAPSWAWAGQRYLERNDGIWMISQVILGEHERFAFLNLEWANKHAWMDMPQLPSTALVVDLSTGEARLGAAVGRSGWSVDEPHLRSYRLAGNIGWPVLSLYEGLSIERKSRQWSSTEDPILFDSFLGESLVGVPNQRMATILDRWDWPQEFDIRAAGSYFRPSGSGVAMSKFTEDPYGWRQLLWDPSRKLMVDRDDVQSILSSCNYPSLFVLPERWLGLATDGSWNLIDPQNGAFERVPKLSEAMRPACFFDDGSILHCQAGRAARLWLEQGLEEEVQFVGLSVPDEMPGWLYSMRPGILSSTLKTVFTYNTGDHDGIALFDPSTNTLDVIGLESQYFRGRLSLIAVGERFAYVTEGYGRLLRLDAESGELHMVFDVESADLGLTDWDVFQ